MAASERPALSVVVVSFSPITQLAGCLESLARQSAGAEIIVVRHASSGAEESAARAICPTVRWVPASDAVVPRMRGDGVRASSGAVVALLEDDCVVAPGFVDHLLAAHATPHAAIGGAVEPGRYRRALDWAAYFCDYSRFMLPFEPGEREALPGNNVSYKREALEGALAPGGIDGLQEAFVHARLRESGESLKADPGLVVHNHHTWTRADLTVVPFHHARAFGGARGRRWPVWRRLAAACACAGLPVLHVGRILIRVVRRRRHMGQLARALAWIVVFGASWAAGEALGYARGPGTSLERWR